MPRARRATALAATLLALFACGGVEDREEDLAWRPAAGLAKQCPALRPDPSGRHLEDPSGRPVFLLGDAAWAIPWKLSRTHVVDYLRIRQGQGFNLVGIIGYSAWHTEPNVYDDAPFPVGDRDWIPSDPITTPGDDPADAEAYDYWDHLLYAIDRACEHGMYVILAPTPGDYIMGNFDGNRTGQIFFDEASAYDFGHFVGALVGDRTNVIWNVGNDRSPITPHGDFRGVVRSMAEGIADGTNGVHAPDGTADWDSTLMTFWPRKSMGNKRAWNSSEWFHQDPWLDFNSIQDWAWDVPAALAHDRALEPTKPTWLFEGRYEAYTPDWTAEHTRFQAWPSVLAGGFGHVFGNEVVLYFGAGWPQAEGDEALWRAALEAPAAVQMGYMRRLMEGLGPQGLASRRPAPELLVGHRGESGTYSSTRREAAVADGGATAVVYVADGSRFEVDPAALSAARADAWWFDPRVGGWADAGGAATARPFRSGLVAAEGRWRFDPPGEPGPGNDWVLVLRRAGTGPLSLSPPAGSGSR